MDLEKLAEELLKGGNAIGTVQFNDIHHNQNVYLQGVDKESTEREASEQTDDEETDDAEQEEEAPRDAELQRKLDHIKGEITNKRLWMPVCCYLMWHGFVAEGDFAAAKRLLEERVEGLDLDANDLRRIYTGCFAKPLNEWNEEKSNIKGNWFSKYLHIAKTMEEY